MEKTMVKSNSNKLSTKYKKYFQHLNDNLKMSLKVFGQVSALFTQDHQKPRYHPLRD